MMLFTHGLSGALTSESSTRQGKCGEGGETSHSKGLSPLHNTDDATDDALATAILDEWRKQHEDEYSWVLTTEDDGNEKIAEQVKNLVRFAISATRKNTEKRKMELCDECSNGYKRGYEQAIADMKRGRHGHGSIR